MRMRSLLRLIALPDTSGRSSPIIVKFPALRTIIDYLDHQPDSRLVVRFAGGDEGLLWAEELRGWFVALGVSGDRITLSAGLDQGDRVVLETK